MKEYTCTNCKKEFTGKHRKNYKFCSGDCASDYKSKQAYQRFLEGGDFYNRDNFIPSKYKKYFLKEQNFKCSICGILNTWNGKTLVFVLDHIDGNASNNVRDNLRLVCPNCDSQLDTYKSKNKNSARKERYLRSKK